MSGEKPGYNPEAKRAYYVMLALLVLTLFACGGVEATATPNMVIENNHPRATEVLSTFLTYRGKIEADDGTLFGAIGRVGARYYEQELVGTDREMNANPVVDGRIPETVWPNLPWTIGFEEHSNGGGDILIVGEAGSVWCVASLFGELGWQNRVGDEIFIAHETNEGAVDNWVKEIGGEEVIKLESAGINVDNGLPYPSSKSEGFIDYWWGELPKENGLERERIVEAFNKDGKLVAVFRGALIEGKGYVWTVGIENRDRTDWEWFPVKLLKREMGRGRSLDEAVQSLEDAQSYREDTRGGSLAKIRKLRGRQTQELIARVRQYKYRRGGRGVTKPQGRRYF